MVLRQYGGKNGLQSDEKSKLDVTLMQLETTLAQWESTDVEFRSDQCASKSIPVKKEESCAGLLVYLVPYVLAYEPWA